MSGCVEFSGCWIQAPSVFDLRTTTPTWIDCPGTSVGASLTLRGRDATIQPGLMLLVSSGFLPMTGFAKV